MNRRLNYLKRRKVPTSSLKVVVEGAGSFMGVESGVQELMRTELEESSLTLEVHINNFGKLAELWSSGNQNLLGCFRHKIGVWPCQHQVGALT